MPALWLARRGQQPRWVERHTLALRAVRLYVDDGRDPAAIEAAINAHNKEQAMRLDHLVRPSEQATESDQTVLPPDEAGTLFIPPDDRLLGGLRHRLNNAIRTTERGKPVVVDMGHVRSNLARRLAAECQQAGWSAEILPVDSVAQDHPLQTGSILKLTKPELAASDGASP